MKKIIKYASISIISLLVLASVFHLGTLAGFHQGTNLSLALSAASIKREIAVTSSIALGLIKSNREDKAISFLESRFKNSVNDYYNFREIKKDVKKALDQNYFKSKLNAFTIYLGPLNAPANYVRNHVSKDEIIENKGFRLLLEEYPNKAKRDPDKVE